MIELSDYARFVRRHLLLLCVLMVTGIAVGAGMVARQSTTYQATTAVVLTRLPSYVSFDPASTVPANVTIDTEAALVGSDATARGVARATGTSPGLVRPNLTVAARPLSNVLEISYEASAEGQAVAGSQAAARALLRQRRQLLLDKQARPLELLGQRLSELVQSAAAESSSVSPNQSKLAAIQHAMEKLRGNLDAVQKSRVQPGRIIEAATVSVKASTHDAALPVVSGALLGLLAAVAIGAWRDLR